MIDSKEVHSILREHQTYVANNRSKWLNYRNAYEDNFWNDAYISTWNGAGVDFRANYPLRVEVNHVRRWLESFIDGLYHKDMHSVVRPDPSDIPEHVPHEASEIIQTVVDGWLNDKAVSQLVERLFLMCLIYPEGAIKLGHKSKGASPVADIWVDVMPAWECVWDRKARSIEDLRYVGHLYPITKKKFKERFPDYKEEIETKKRADVLLGEDPKAMVQDADDSYIEILEFYDLEGKYKDEETDGEFDGELRVFIVDNEGVKHVKSEAMPFTNIDETALASIVPSVLLSKPEYPLCGIPSVKTVYQRNEEINWSRTFMANGVRADAARKTIARKGALDKDAKAALHSGNDRELVEVEAESLENVLKEVELPQIAQSLREYFVLLEQDREATDGLNPTARGQALNYASAQEAQNLQSYTDTLFGRRRKKMDHTLVMAMKLYLRVLAFSMDDQGLTALPVMMGDKMMLLERDWLDINWQFSIADQASTPMMEQQKRVEFIQVQPVMMALAEQLDMGGMVAAMAEAQLKYIADIFALPPEFEINMLRGVAGTKTPAQPELPPGPPAMPPGPPGLGALPPGLEGLPPAAPPILPEGGIDAGQGTPLPELPPQI